MVVAAALCVRLANVLFPCDAMPVLHDRMLDIATAHNGQPRALLKAGIFLLGALCDEAPRLFDQVECVQQLRLLLDQKEHKALSFVALRIHAKSVTPGSFGEQAQGQLQGGADELEPLLADLTDRAKHSSDPKEADDDMEAWRPTAEQQGGYPGAGQYSGAFFLGPGRRSSR